MTPKTAKAMAAAGARAAQTPEEVRHAWMEKRYAVPGLELEPMSIAILWVLEEIKHPLLEPPKDGEPPAPLSRRDLARAVFAFADSECAFEALSGGADAFDAEAFKLARNLPPASVLAAMQMIPTIIAEGLATLPGAGAANPPEAAA